MKKLLCVLLVIILTVYAAACAAEPPATEPTTTAPTEITTVPTETTEPDEGGTADYQSPMIAVSFPAITDAKKNETGTLISEYRYPEFTVALPDADVAEAVQLDLLNRIDSTSAAAEAMHEAAQNASQNPGFQPYLYEISYEVQRLDQNILSLYSTETYFDGTPRTVRSGHSVSYDLSTGNALNLSAIMQEDYSADILVELIVEGLSSHTDSLFTDYQTTVKEKFSTNVPVESWYFSNAGLCFYFAPYEIAPVSMGSVVSCIPYEKLSGMLNEQFFPAEALTYSGDVKLQAVTGEVAAATEGFAQFSELNLESGKDHYLLSVDGSLANLRIYTTGQDGSNDVMVYAAAGLGSTDCILIEADGAAISDKLVIEWLVGDMPMQLTVHVDDSGTVTLQ